MKHRTEAQENGIGRRLRVIGIRAKRLGLVRQSIRPTVTTGSRFSFPSSGKNVESAA